MLNALAGMCEQVVMRPGCLGFEPSPLNPRPRRGDTKEEPFITNPDVSLACHAIRVQNYGMQRRHAARIREPQVGSPDPCNG